MNEASAADGRLRGARFELQAKLVIRAAHFHDFVGIADRPDLVGDLARLIAKLESGVALPDRFYRAGVDRDEDRLLDETGLKHLHLGGRHSDVLVFLVEYADRVVLLEINDHKHFRTDPPGTLLRALHGGLLGDEDAAAERRRIARTASRRLAIRSGLRPRRPR